MQAGVGLLPPTSCGARMRGIAGGGAHLLDTWPLPLDQAWPRPGQAPSLLRYPPSAGRTSSAAGAGTLERSPSSRRQRGSPQQPPLLLQGGQPVKVVLAANKLFRGGEEEATDTASLNVIYNRLVDTPPHPELSTRAYQSRLKILKAIHQTYRKSPQLQTPGGPLAVELIIEGLQDVAATLLLMRECGQAEQAVATGTAFLASGIAVRAPEVARDVALAVALAHKALLLGGQGPGGAAGSKQQSYEHVQQALAVLQKWDAARSLQADLSGLITVRGRGAWGTAAVLPSHALLLVVRVYSMHLLCCCFFTRAVLNNNKSKLPLIAQVIVIHSHPNKCLN